MYTRRIVNYTFFYCQINKFYKKIIEDLIFKLIMYDKN